MRRIFLFCILIIGIGCSDHSNESVNEQNTVDKAHAKPVPPIEDSIDLLFYNFVNSSSYQESNQLLTDFQTKFRVFVSQDDFNSEIEMLQWIGLNLDKTDFTSLSEAQLKWQPISNLLEINYNNNQELFEFIRNSNPEVSIYYFEKYIIKNTTEEDLCTKQLKQCEANALTALINEVAYSAGGPEALIVYRIAHFFFNKSIQTCANNFEACVANS